MIAIRLTKANEQKILNESPIDPRDLRAMIEEYDTPHGPSALYFIPQSDMAHSLDRDSWMTLPAQALDKAYLYDKNKINNQFVPIHLK